MKFKDMLREFAGERSFSSRVMTSKSLFYYVKSLDGIGISVCRASPVAVSEMLIPAILAAKVTVRIRSSGESRV
jgi:hypothetical protein